MWPHPRLLPSQLQQLHQQQQQRLRRRSRGVFTLRRVVLVVCCVALTALVCLNGLALRRRRSVVETTIPLEKRRSSSARGHPSREDAAPEPQEHAPVQEPVRQPTTAAAAAASWPSAPSARPTKKMKKRRRRRKPVVKPTKPYWPRRAVAFPFDRPQRPVQSVIQHEMIVPRKFRVGPRKDLENFVAPLLTRLGLTQTKKMDWEVYIGLQFKLEYEKNYLAAPEGAIMSSVPGLREVLGDKEAFANLWRDCVAAGNLWCDWTTPAYNVLHKAVEVDGTSSLAVEGGGAAFYEAMVRHGPSTWIVKPQRRYLSLGMHLAAVREADLGSLGDLAAWVKREVPLEEEKQLHHTKQPGEFTLQKYVERPGTLGTRKFDLRLWVFLASLEPLTIYILDVGFPKISVVDYTGWDLPNNATTIDDKCMHIQMMASEVCTKRMRFPHPFPFDYPGITRPDVNGTGDAFFEELLFDESPRTPDEKWERWQTELWPALERTVLAPLLLAKPKLLEHEARIFGEAGNGLSRRSRRFALLSPDALWDRDTGEWRLEEVNTNGLFQLGADEGTGGKTYHEDVGYTEGWLHIAGASGFPNKGSYAATLERRLDAFCAANECGDDRQTLELAAHMDAHTSGGWYRAWPPVTSCGASCERRRADVLDGLLAPSRLERLTTAWLGTLDERYYESEAKKKENGQQQQQQQQRSSEEEGLVFPDYIV